MEEKKLKILFLGVCERYLESEVCKVTIDGGDPNDVIQMNKKSLIGLKSVHVTTLLPLPIHELHFVVAITMSQDSSYDFKMIVKDPNGEICGHFEINARAQSLTNSEKTVNVRQFVDLVAFQIAQDKVGFSAEGEYLVFTKESEDELCQIGAFQIIFQETPRLTDEQKEKIENDYLAIKKARFRLQCNTCEVGICAYVALNKKDIQRDDIWYEDLDDIFTCKCKTSYDLSFLRRGLHYVLGKHGRPTNPAIEAVFDESKLSKTLSDFKTIIEEESKEAIYQSFMEENHFVFSNFSPQLIGHKNPILSFYETDFVVLDSRGILHLIEIEKPSTKIFKGRGDQHSDLTHAVDQVGNWLDEFSKDRGSAIRALKLEGLDNPEKVVGVRGVVIAGRSVSKDQKYMSKLLARHNDIEIYTFDDLLKNMASAIKSTRGL